jgi:hypothetical protein
MPPINVCQTWKPKVIPHARTYPPRRVAGAWSQALVARVSEEMEEPMLVGDRERRWWDMVDEYIRIASPVYVIRAPVHDIIGGDSCIH